MNSNCDGGLGHSTPISGTFLDCCARAARGQTAAALPNVTMNSRRLMGFTPVAETRSLAHLFRDLCWLTRDFGTGRTRTACPLWVKSRHLHCTSPCPLYPQKRTYAMQLWMSAMGQKRTSPSSKSQLAHRQNDLALTSFV